MSEMGHHDTEEHFESRIGALKTPGEICAEVQRDRRKRVRLKLQVSIIVYP
jgi:hypothetical protein